MWKVHLDRPGMPGWSALSEAECERALRFADPLERRRWVVARSTLKQILGELCGIPAARLAFSTEGGGRPRIAFHTEGPHTEGPQTEGHGGGLGLALAADGSDRPLDGCGCLSDGCDRPSAGRGLDFNLSHSGEWALIAVAPEGRRVGVDVERISPDADILELAARMYQPEEVERVRAAGAPEFFRLWTAKEAYIKATGVGLAGLRDTRVTPAREGSAALVGSRSLDGEWPVRWLDVAPGYAAAVVTTASTPEPRTG
ncbi:4'-phosphopantetheinyl transferase family protein [Nonomuraea endophytica]|uniref:4'-phosphopantetheinyl transferase n=1 Tax=Nonomuraea endophytica TaxID=714136 RepID=A0A7W8EJ39_9ACTN|nr:4'-phosphopantetheinyl transferase superfamily protein [Nonomuraea endophytica]MBB5082705.1 4'-phosphopantetheinyl transferase [Nonomuraea endophytica]